MEHIKFKIDHMDPMGQGVSKESQIAFIEKTLPGETGTAEIYRKAKGVIFGNLSDPENLNTKSPDRIEPECPHFYECRGCQFLHTNYNNEINFKTESLKRMFKNLLSDSVELIVHPAQERFGYRNRIQIHYDLLKEELGYFSNLSRHLINVQNCLLPSNTVMKQVNDIYSDNKWKNIVANSNDKTGYIEVYQKPDETESKISLNKPYAEGGFTQVNNKMGQVLTELVTKMYKKYLGESSENLVLDIFGGNGNLSKYFQNADIKVFDLNRDSKVNPNATMQSTHQQYVNIDLYKKDPVNEIKKSLKDLKESDPNLIIFDPPRAGVKFINSYIKYLDAPSIFYISCDPATLKRDTVKLKDKYDIVEMHLIDLFPGTRHFETLIVFRKSE